MKRIRLSTLMLSIVVAGLGLALVVRDRRATPREAELRIRLRNTISALEVYELNKIELKKRVKNLQVKLDELGRSPDGVERIGDGK